MPLTLNQRHCGHASLCWLETLGSAKFPAHERRSPDQTRLENRRSHLNHRNRRHRRSADAVPQAMTGKDQHRVHGPDYQAGFGILNHGGSKVREGLSNPTVVALSPPVFACLFVVKLASARESLCRGLGSSWFTERFHRNALVTHFQHGQVFCTARQLKDYAVTGCRLHQRAPQR
jgi:hypothetical protein